MKNPSHQTSSAAIQPDARAATAAAAAAAAMRVWSIIQLEPDGKLVIEMTGFAGTMGAAGFAAIKAYDGFAADAGVAIFTGAPPTDGKASMKAARVSATAAARRFFA